MHFFFWKPNIFQWILHQAKGRGEITGPWQRHISLDQLAHSGLGMKRSVVRAAECGASRLALNAVWHRQIAAMCRTADSYQARECILEPFSNSIYFFTMKYSNSTGLLSSWMTFNIIHGLVCLKCFSSAQSTSHIHPYIHTLMVEAAMQGANYCLGASWCSVSCSRTLQHFCFGHSFFLKQP